VISYPVKRKDGSHLPWDDDITVTAVIERHLIDANLLSVCHSALLAVLSDPIVAAGMLGVLDAFFCSHLRRVLWARLHRNLPAPKAKPEAKLAPVETTTVPTPSPDPLAEPADTPLAQVATVPPAQEPEVSVPSTVPDSAKPTTPSAAAVATNPPETNTAALGSPNTEQVVAVVLVREEIKSLTELSNKTVAIDGLQAAEIPNIKTAIMKSGAKDVRISEDEKLALDRVTNGEVPAGVISVVSPEEAAQWTGVPGYTVLRLPLQRTKGSPG
jgi:hypothetical protein